MTIMRVAAPRVVVGEVLLEAGGGVEDGFGDEGCRERGADCDE
jgi:hypothetical protein